MITHTTEFEVTRGGQEMLVSVTGCIEPYREGRTYGDPENCYPPEGGYAEIKTATLDGKPFYLTVSELAAVERQLYEEWEGSET